MVSRCQIAPDASPYVAAPSGGVHDVGSARASQTPTYRPDQHGCGDPLHLGAQTKWIEHPVSSGSDLLVDHIGGPVLVDNDVNWAARGERYAVPDLDDFAYLHLGEGPGL